MSRLQQNIGRNPQAKVIFTDLFDTLVHRTVHPNYTLKLWGKFLVRELGLSTNADTLFAVRAEAVFHLSKRLELRSVEIDYAMVITEVYHRLVNSNLLKGVPYERFEQMFQEADYVAETAVQFKNESLLAELLEYKERGYRIFLITDFYLPIEQISRILDFHGISFLFEDVFVSCSLGKSKEKGDIYPYVLNHTETDSKEAIMMGDNKSSDVEHAEKHGMKAIHLKHFSHKIRNRKNLFGTEARPFQKVCQHLERQCRKSPHPFSEYILHYYFFTERLFIKAKQDGIKNLFFLAREGFYLKRLFDTYQELNRLTGSERIDTHYLKMSRHSALQVALRPLEDEDFSAFRGNLGRLNASDFLTGLDFPKAIKKQVMDGLGEVPEQPDPDFFRSETMSRLRNDSTFTQHYECYRKSQKTAFDAYLASFSVNFEQEGIHLVDVGWGGTMQENLYRFLEKKIPVTGYYLGLKEVYNIQPDTKRFGLNFSIYPSRNFADEVLQANGQLYEQLLGAPHGSTTGYTKDDPETFAVGFHEENEKLVFENWVRPVQDYMFVQFKNLFENLRSIDYPQELAQQYMTEMALRSGILAGKKNVEFVDRLSKGFYQNAGQHQVGVAYSPTQIKGSKMGLLASFIKSPEKLFRYLVKVKPYLFSKGLYWLSWPFNLTYYYIKLNFWFKRKWLAKGLI